MKLCKWNYRISIYYNIIEIKVLVNKIKDQIVIIIG